MSAEAPMLDVVIPVRDAEARLRATLRALGDQQGVAPGAVRVIVVDDGSTPALDAEALDSVCPGLAVERSASWKGRAQARNAGSSLGEAPYLLFLDADCRPAGPRFLARLLAHIDAGADVLFGAIRGEGQGFWPRYLSEVERTRRAKAEDGDYLGSITSANLTVRRDLFERVGGFWPEYRWYGFEDKDLVAGLLALGSRVVFDSDLVVVHDARNTVDNYCEKMGECGHYSAPLFANRFPDAYRAMGFSRIDPDMRPGWQRPMLVLASWFAGPLRWLARILVELKFVPWAVRHRLVKSAAALGYLRGALRRS